MFTIVYNFNQWHTKEHKAGGKRLFQNREWKSVNWDLERNPRDRNLMRWDELLPVLASVIDYMENEPEEKTRWRVFRYSFSAAPVELPKYEMMHSLKKWLIKEKGLTEGDAKILGFTLPEN
ncbi:MAG: hypothetical protein RLZZ234_629 [Candidatus Parcubacteria bacterium]